MKNKIIIAVIVLAVAFFAAKFFLKSQVQTATEEVIMYDNDVIKTIDAHLQNLPIEEIRKKKNL